MVDRKIIWIRRKHDFSPGKFVLECGHVVISRFHWTVDRPYFTCVECYEKKR